MNKNHEPPRKALGRGLSTLLPMRSGSAAAAEPARSDASEVEHHSTGVAEIPIDVIVPNPLQPRTVFEPEKLAELAQSIRANGIIQPLVVQKIGERYQLVAGERRWRAA